MRSPSKGYLRQLSWNVLWVGRSDGKGSRATGQRQLKVAAKSQSKQATTGTYLLRVLELPPEAVIHSFGDLLRSANNSFDINFKATIQKLVDFTIVIVIISVKRQSENYCIFSVYVLFL